MLKIDRHVIIQVLGGLMNKPDFLSDTDKYRLELSDFPNSLDKFIFSAINNLYNDGEGATKIRAIDISNYLKENTTAATLIEKENGEVFLQDCEATGDPNSFNYYYQKLKKLNFLKDIESTGHSISKFYCEDIFNPDYNLINENFERMSINDILNELKLEVNHFESKFAINTVIEESKASDGINELVEELKKVPEVGCKLQGDIFNTVCRGGRKGKLYLRSAGSGVGKAIPDYVKIPTPNGWTTVGQVRPGDYLFDRHGNPTKVLAIYPQVEKKQIYKVYFKSGKIAECCGEHLWSYYISLKEKKLSTKSTEEIYNKSQKNGFKKFGKYLYCVPTIEPIQLKERKLSISPYIMGLLLGGDFKHEKDSKVFTFQSENEELLFKIATELGLSLKKCESNKYSWNFEYLDNSKIDILKNYFSTNNFIKSIPEEYLFCSKEQRLELLQGLLDMAGSFVLENGRINFTTNSNNLQKDFVALCSSLGFLTYSYIEKTSNNRNIYHVDLIVNDSEKSKLFKSENKIQEIKSCLPNHKIDSKINTKVDPIVKIEKTENYTSMTCFYVDNEEHLFAAGDTWWMTHNTRSMVGDACNIAYPVRFDRKKNKWVSTGSAEKVLYVMTEQDTDEIKTMILAYLTGYNEEIFLYGTYGKEEMPRIQQAVEIMKQYSDNMLLARIPDPSASAVKNLFRRYSIQYNVENFFYDYIFSSPAMLEEYRDLKLPEYVCLRLFTTALKNLAIELNAFVLTSTQVSNDDGEGGFKDFKNIQGSKSIANLTDLACVMSRPSKDELETLSGFKNCFSFSPNLVIDIFKNRRGRWNMIRIWAYADLGCCRREDLFVTTTDLKPIEDFKVVEFSALNYKNYQALCDKLNENSGITDSINEKDKYDLETFSNITPEQLLENPVEAFHDEIDLKKQVANKSFSDFF